MIQSNAGDRKAYRKAYYQIANACQNNQKVTATIYHKPGLCLPEAIALAMRLSTEMSMVEITPVTGGKERDVFQSTSQFYLPQKSVNVVMPRRTRVPPQYIILTTTLVYFSLYFKSLRGIQENESHVDRE